MRTDHHIPCGSQFSEQALPERARLQLVGGVNANLLLDPLSITFVLLITGVGSLIHIYSIGYMAHDPEIWGQAGGPSR